MKKNRIIAVVLAATLVCSLAGVSALAAGKQKNDTSSTPAAQADSADTTPSSATGETVYVIANADGSAKKVIVSQKYDPDDPNAAQEAQSSLTDAQNVKGDNCWQGTTDKPLPVTMHITYTLDGKSVTADALAGKSGHVTMRFDYENTQYETKTITGSIFIRIADRLPLPEHTSTQILFRICIRTRITYAGRTVPYTCKTCFCQTAILFHFK